MNRKIYVQCPTRGRATLAAKQLRDIGFTSVTAVVMELVEWQKKGHPSCQRRVQMGPTSRAAAE